jgi:uncharacterized protein (UPF0332 family)
MTKGTGELLKYRISRSRETLAEAETMMKSGFWNAAVNRIYYACYYIVSALYTKEID